MQNNKFNFNLTINDFDTSGRKMGKEISIFKAVSTPPFDMVDVKISILGWKNPGSRKDKKHQYVKDF